MNKYSTMVVEEELLAIVSVVVVVVCLRVQFSCWLLVICPTPHPLPGPGLMPSLHPRSEWAAGRARRERGEGRCIETAVEERARVSEPGSLGPGVKRLLIYIYYIRKGLKSSSFLFLFLVFFCLLHLCFLVWFSSCQFFNNPVPMESTKHMMMVGLVSHNHPPPAPVQSLEPRE